MRSFRYVFLFVLALPCQPVLADHQFKIPRWYLSLSQSSGGDNVATVDILEDSENSDEVISSRSLTAGDGFQLSIGNAWRIKQTPFSVRGTIGWFSDKFTASRGKAQFTRLPLELFGFYAYGNHRLGVGGVLHLLTELDIEDAAGPVVEFDPAPGVGIEYGYALGGLGYLSKYWIGLRYVSVDYTVSDVGGADLDGPDLRFDGSHVAAFLAIAW